jgi:hypothetical protein
MPSCDNCTGVFVRGRYGWYYGSLGFSCGGDVCGKCTGIGTTSNPPTPCQAFCMTVKENDWSNPDQPQTFDKNFLNKYGALFSHFGWPIPDSCTCSRGMLPSDSDYSNYCRECVALPPPAGGTDYFSACKRADWCDENCPPSDRCFFEEGDLCSAIGIPPGEECIERAATKQCQKLFSEEGESVPQGCSSSPIDTLKDKCNQIKKGGRKEAPEPCKILPLFIGKLESPEPDEIVVEPPSYPSQKIINYPSSILGCPASFPTIPKICLPSIKLPDIKLPEFKLSIMGFKLFHLKLPSLITEDLNFPCIELCNINECRDIFPAFNFQMPVLSIPTVEIPPIHLGEVLGVPLPDLVIDPISFPHIPYPIFRLPTLGDVIMPELDYSGTNLPRPRINYSFSGIDLSAIWGYIATFIKNALGIPDFSLCISANLLKPIPIELTYPDRYFSFCQLGDIIKGKAGKVIKTLCKLRIPEIPYCQDVNEFCLKMRTKMAEVTNKVKEIERVFNELIQKEIQSKLDQAAPLIQKELEKSIQKKLEPIREEIRRQAEEQIREGKTEIVIKINPIEIPALPLDNIVKIPTKIPIPWPKDLLKIQLTCNESGYNQCQEAIRQECNQECAGKKVDRCNLDYLKCLSVCQIKKSLKCEREYPQCLSYDLPTIPLSCLSYEKEFPIKGPGLQSTSFILETNLTECQREIPIGGNPCPKNEFQNNLGKIKNIKDEIEKTSQKITDILE